MPNTISPSNHPLAGHSGAFFGILSIVVDGFVATALLYILAKWVAPPTAPIVLFGLNYPLELVAVLGALGYYWLSGIFSVRRERSRAWANIDLVGTLAVAAVLIAAALPRVHPMFKMFYENLRLPVVEYTSLNMAILVFFGIAVSAYFVRYHFQRAQVGLEGLQQGTRSDVLREQNLDQNTGQASLNLAGLGVFANGFAVMPIKDDQELTYVPKRGGRLASVA